jgi:hypothetical protein
MVRAVTDIVVVVSAEELSITAKGDGDLRLSSLCIQIRRLGVLISLGAPFFQALSSERRCNLIAE